MSHHVLEICAGGGGQAIGLEMAGFSCAGAVEIDHHSCDTLRLNRPRWRVVEGDVRDVNGRDFAGVDLFAGGVPCPPFSIAGKQLGTNDERDLFPEALRLIGEIRPAAVMLENVPGFASSKFESYRRGLWKRLAQLGYEADWRILNARDFGVPQLRPRFVLVAMKPYVFSRFAWPEVIEDPPTVGDVLFDLMAARGWPGAKAWKRMANDVAPTLVGGSHKHGGPDLGPTRARAGWASLGVNGLGVADEAPGPDFPPDGMPKITVRMAARVQGFPDSWEFSGKKTAQYRQVGNAFPPPVAMAVARALLEALNGITTTRIPAAGILAAMG